MAATNYKTNRRSTVAKRSGVERFFSWWGRELAWFVPDFLKDHGLPAARLVWLEVTSQAAIFRRIRSGRLEELGRIDLSEADPIAEKIVFDKFAARLRKKQPVGILVNPEQVLNKQVNLPLAARDNIEQVIQFEMDRQTPYRHDKVFSYFHESGVKGDQVLVDLAVVPRHAVDHGLSKVREWELNLHGIGVAGEVAKRANYRNFYPKASRPPTGRIWPMLYGLMGLISVAIVAGILILPIWQKRAQAISLMPEVAKAEREAKVAAALKEKLNSSMAWHNHLLEQRLNTIPAVALIEETTRLLPDNTWLQSLEIREKEVMLQGESTNPSRLIAIFEKSGTMHEAAFRAPLVKIRDDLQRFQISALIKPVDSKSVDSKGGVKSAEAVPAKPVLDQKARLAP